MPARVTFFAYHLSDSPQSRRTDCTKDGHQQEGTAEREKQENKKLTHSAAQTVQKGRAQRQASETDKHKAKLRAQDSDHMKTKPAKIGIAECGASASKRTKKN